MKYPVIYVKNVMGVHKHNSISYALHMRIVGDETGDELRAAYLKKLLSQLYHTIAGLFVVAQGEIIKNDGDPFILFTTNLDQRQLKMQLQTLANELSERAGDSVQLEYALFRSLLLVKDGPVGLFKAAKEGKPVHQSDALKECALLLKSDGRKVTTNYLMSYDVFVERTKA